MVLVLGRRCENEVLHQCFQKHCKPFVGKGKHENETRSGFFAIEARVHWRRFILAKTLVTVYFGKNVGDGLFWRKNWQRFILAKTLVTVYFGENIGDGFFGENIGDGLFWRKCWRQRQTI
jgi:hypothetical protein